LLAALGRLPVVDHRQFEVSVRWRSLDGLPHWLYGLLHWLRCGAPAP
jgi:hypothetical protein